MSYKRLISCFFFVSVFATSVFSQTTIGPYTYTPGPGSMMILGVATIDENTPPDGSVIAAFDSDGNCAGAAELIVQGASSYIQLPIYPDDSTTPSIDEGMNSGENFTIELWDGANINDHDTEYDCWVSNNGAPMNGCLSDYTQEVPFTSSGSGGADDWPEYAYPFDDFTPGPASMAFLGIATINGEASSSGDVIAAFDQDGTSSGYGELVVNGGTGYISFTIYGDDSATEEDEGIGAGDDFYLTLYDASENMTMTYMQTFDCWANENGASHEGCGDDYLQVWNFTGSCGDDNVWCGGGLNNPPVANDQSVTTDEDVSLEIVLTGSDAEGDPLTFTIVDAPSYGALDGLGSTGDYTSTVMYAPDEDFNGSDSFTFTVNDGGNDSENVGTVSISITLVNDPPEFSLSASEFTADEDDFDWGLITFGIGTVPEDEQGQEVSYSLDPSSVDFATINFSSDEGKFVIFPVQDGFGTQDFIVTADDGQAENNLYTQIFTLTINPVNDSPVADAGEDQEHTASYQNNYQVDVSLDGSGSADVDGNIESYSWTEDGEEIATGANPNVSLGVGVHSITLTVSDDSGSSGSDNVIITINQEGNYPPSADAGTDQGPYSATYENNYEISVNLDGSGSSDVDGTIVTYSWSENGSEIASSVNASVSLGVGEHNITLTVTDDDGDSDSDEIIITIYQEENYPPIANAGEDQSISLDPGDPDPAVTFDGSGSFDVDGTIISYSWTEDGDEIATGISPTVVLSPGLHEIMLTVFDDDDATDLDEVLVNVIVTGQHWFPPDPSAFYHLIYIGDVSIGNTVLEAGADEIGIFDGDVLVGSDFYGGTPGQAIQAWVDNEMF